VPLVDTVTAIDSAKAPRSHAGGTYTTIAGVVVGPAPAMRMRRPLLGQPETTNRRIFGKHFFGKTFPAPPIATTYRSASRHLAEPTNQPTHAVLGGARHPTAREGRNDDDEGEPDQPSPVTSRAPPAIRSQVAVKPTPPSVQSPAHLVGRAVNIPVASRRCRGCPSTSAAFHERSCATTRELTPAVREQPRPHEPFRRPELVVGAVQAHQNASPLAEEAFLRDLLDQEVPRTARSTIVALPRSNVFARSSISVADCTG